MVPLPPSDRPPRFALRAAGLTKVFGETVALWNVNLDCLSGDLLAIHGTNGSGKSTLLRLLAGLSAPTRGGVSWASDAPGRFPRIGLLGHTSHLFDELTAFENVALAARLAGRHESTATALLGRLGADRYAARRAKHLSAGTRRRVGLARLLATDPDVLLVDEPFAGLDEAAGGLVSDILAAARDEGRLVLIATHDGSRSRFIATKSVELDAGRIRATSPGSLEALAT